ncbi:MAG: 16S rRNA (guanine(527)-N(7))-methyltransferase RsmG [Clostridia bacterium]|nr:16S rRNA (guanine(527)-N(7))-methyltransferase RsmG [Clostridia bacterium]
MNGILLQNGINLDNKSIECLQTFCDFLLQKNKQFNLTAIKEKQEVYLKHFADSLIGTNFFINAGRVLEVGSGGGFPSIPLKIANRDINFTLMEATGKKCTFLKECANLFNFENFEVLNLRAEEASKNTTLRESFDTVTARAVASLNVLSELCMPYLKVGGKAVFYKQFSESEFEEGKKSVELLGGKIDQVKKYKLIGLDQERCLIIIKKVKNTPEKYPREYKKIIKTPL